MDPEESSSPTQPCTGHLKNPIMCLSALSQHSWTLSGWSCNHFPGGSSAQPPSRGRMFSWYLTQSALTQHYAVPSCPVTGHHRGHQCLSLRSLSWGSWGLPSVSSRPNRPSDLSPYGFPSRPFTILVALLWKLSNSCPCLPVRIPGFLGERGSRPRALAGNPPRPCAGAAGPFRAGAEPRGPRTGRTFEEPPESVLAHVLHATGHGLHLGRHPRAQEPAAAAALAEPRSRPGRHGRAAARSAPSPRQGALWGRGAGRSGGTARRVPAPAADGGAADAVCPGRSRRCLRRARRPRARRHDRGALREVLGPRGAVPAALAPAPAAGRQLEPERGGLPGRQRFRLSALLLPPHRPSAPLPLQQVRSAGRGGRAGWCRGPGAGGAGAAPQKGRASFPRCPGRAAGATIPFGLLCVRLITLQLTVGAGAVF